MGAAQFGVGACFAASLLALAAWARFPVPYKDDWDLIPLALEHGGLLRELWRPHNEHLIVIPRAVYALELVGLGSWGRLPLAIAVAAHTATATIVIREILAAPAGRSDWKWITAGVALVLLTFSYQLQSFVFAGALPFTLVLAFACLALRCFLNAIDGEGVRSVWLLGAFAAALGAALTTPFGAFVPFALGATALARRTSVAVVGLCGLTGLAFLVLYRVLAVPAVPHDLPRIDIETLVYFLAFLGSFATYLTPIGGAGVGAIGLLTFASLSVWSLGGGRQTRLVLFCFGLGAFLLACGFATAIGRAASFGPEQAAQSRYSTLSLAFWAIVVAMGAPVVLTTARRTRKVAIVALLISLAALPMHILIGVVWHARAKNAEAAVLALSVGVDDEPWVRTIHADPRRASEVAQLLRDRQPRVLRAEEIGRSAPASLEYCGADLVVDLHQSPGQGWRVTGRGMLRTATKILVADRDNVVRGIARKAPMVAEPNPTQRTFIIAALNALRGRSVHHLDWLGFSQAGAGPPYVAYALEEERTICQTMPLGGRSEVVAYTPHTNASALASPGSIGLR
jgi:hypothetical protein